jgi:hypothetical protein
VAYYRLYVNSLPAFGGSVMELGSNPGSQDAPIPDAQRSRSRSFQRGRDKAIDRITVSIETFIQNPDWRPPPRWYCTPCGQLRSYEDRFCRLCGGSRPEEEPDGR